MNVLITGVDGFIGRHASLSLAANHNVFGVARQLPSAGAHPAVERIYADLSEPSFEKLLPAGIDCVIHLAQSQKYRNFPEGAADMRCINVDATCKLLEWSRKIGVKHFIFTSTANVYGKTSARMTETLAANPESFYGASKLAAEILARQYQAYFQVDILRLFTVYGPDQKSMLISNLIERVKSGGAIMLAQGIGLYLTPIYVSDVVTAFEKLIEMPCGSSSGLFNVCGDEVLHLGEIVKAIESAVNIKALTQHTDEIVPRFVGSNAALKEYLGLHQSTNIESGLSLTVGSG